MADVGGLDNRGMILGKRGCGMFDKAHVIIQQESLMSGVPVKMLISKSRTKTVVQTRQRIRERLRFETALSWAEINQLTGRGERNHRF